MEITREDLNPCTVQLTVVCDPSEVQDGFGRAFKKLSKKIRVPGFRPGTAPKAILKDMVSKDDLYETAADLIVRDAFREALKKEELEPHSSPAVELKSLDEEEAKCEFVVKVPLAPQVTLGEYKGLSAKRPSLEVTEAELDQQIESMRQRKSSREAVVGRGAEPGDIAVVNIKLEDQEGDGRTFMTMVGQTFPQLDELLLGMQAEEIKNAELTFPSTFQEKDWAEKTLKCHVTLRTLSAPRLPELDDSFAQEFQVENMEALREELRREIPKAKADYFNGYVNEQLLDMLKERSEVVVPDTMWESVANQRIRDIAQEQAKTAKTLEQYASQNNMTVDELVAAQQEEAKLHVIRAVLVQKVFEAEGMKLTNTELNTELLKMSREYNIAPQELLKALQKNKGLDELHFRAIFEKVTTFLRENAEIEEIDESQPAS